MPLEHRPAVQERRDNVIRQHDVRRHVPGDDVAENALADRTASCQLANRATAQIAALSPKRPLQGR
jgi:hypothetical protein